MDSRKKLGEHQQTSQAHEEKVRNVVVQLELLQMRAARKSIEKKHQCRNKS